MSFNTLDLLRAFELSLKKARLLVVGLDFRVEIWVDMGHVTRVEGCAGDALGDYLILQPVDVWIRPYDSIAEGQVNVPINSLAASKELETFSLPVDALVPPAYFPENLYTQKIERMKPNSVISQPTSKPPVSQLKVAAVGRQTINVENQLPVTHTMVTFKLGLPETKVIGRQPDCQIVLDQFDVSRRHCELVFDGTKLEVKDLGSVNGTFVNGNQVTDSKISSHDILNVGNSYFIIVINP